MLVGISKRKTLGRDLAPGNSEKREQAVELAVAVAKGRKKGNDQGLIMPPCSTRNSAQHFSGVLVLWSFSYSLEGGLAEDGTREYVGMLPGVHECRRSND